MFAMFMEKGLSKTVTNANYEVFIVQSYIVWHAFQVYYSLSKTFQYRDVDLSLLQPAVTLAIQKLDIMKIEPGQNFSFFVIMTASLDIQWQKKSVLGLVHRFHTFSHAYLSNCMQLF